MIVGLGDSGGAMCRGGGEVGLLRIGIFFGFGTFFYVYDKFRNREPDHPPTTPMWPFSWEESEVCLIFKVMRLQEPKY